MEKGSNWNITAWKRGLLVGILGLAMVGMAASIRGRQAEDDNSIDVLSDVSEKKEIQKQEPKKIALTFDDGPHKIYTEKLLDGLAERNVKATFFLLGTNIEGKEDIVKRIAEEGHLIGNHTYYHVDIGQA